MSRKLTTKQAADFAIFLERLQAASRETGFYVCDLVWSRGGDIVCDLDVEDSETHYITYTARFTQ